MQPASDIVLQASSIGKQYGATCALRGADLVLRSGRVHALLGENGAGKSTLVKIIVGAVQPDAGRILLSGRPVTFSSVSEAIAAGITPIYQHLSLFPELSVLENLSAFSLACTSSLTARPALVDRGAARGWLAEVGLQVDLDRPVASLTLGERQLLEIARGLGQRCRLLVLDEPTAALNGEEAERLFAVVRRLCAAGTAVLFISHKFDEIEALADDVTVLRDGRTVIDAAPVGTHSRSELVAAMLGVAVAAVQHAARPRGEPFLMAQDLCMSDGRALRISVGRGEIVGLAGLVGSGALQIAAIMAGAGPARGRVRVGDASFRAGDRHAAVALGVGYIPADRHAEGLFMPISATRNGSSSALGRFATLGFLHHRRENKELAPLLRDLALHPNRPDAEAASFSGGNQQKLLVARCLALPNLSALVLLEPTRGVDVAARATIHRTIRQAAERGVAVLIASSDLDELMALCDRYLIVRDAEIVEDLPRGTDSGALMGALAGRAAA